MIPHLEEMQHYTNVICVKYPDKPWERVESRYSDMSWSKMTKHPCWMPGTEYRFLPDTIKVGDIELPEPLRVEPKEGETVYGVFPRYACTEDNMGVDVFQYRAQFPYSKWAFNNGFLHATQENAQAWLDYFAKLARGE